MMGFAVAAFIVAVAVILVWLSLKAVEGNMLMGAAALGLVTAILGVVINASIKEDKKGPCHQYETQMIYNAATKSMMPSRVCVLRGEWVK